MQYTTWNSNVIDVNHLAFCGRQVSYTRIKELRLRADAASA